MSLQAWTDLSILEGGIELRAHASSAMFATEVAPQRSTTFASGGWEEYVAGGKTATVDVSLFQDVADGSIDEVLWDQFGASDVARSFVTANVDGSVAWLMRGVPVQYTPSEGEANSLATAKLTARASGACIRGRLLHPGGTARTSSSTGTGRQLGAVASGKSLYAALHVLTVSGTSTPTLTVKVQSDDNSNFTSPTDRITFTGATAAATYQWGSVAGSITDDYWRISYTITGSTPSFTFAVTCGIV